MSYEITIGTASLLPGRLAGRPHLMAMDGAFFLRRTRWTG